MLFAGAGLTAVNFVNILFSILIGQFLSLNPLLNAGGRHEIGGILKASILSSVVLRKHGIFRVSSIRSLDFIDDLFDVWWRWVGKCESFSIPLFSPCYLISHHSLYLFITKFGYNARCHRWKERALWEYGA